MRFTVVLSSPESQDLVFGLSFIPTVCWISGYKGEVLVNSHEVRYKKGMFKLLLEQIESDICIVEKKAAIIIHDVGQGNLKDLETLQYDLVEEGYKVNKVFL